MFGFGNRYQGRRVRNDTFGGSRLRNAAIAGVGMLAWRWWKNRQTNQPANYQRQSFSDSQTRGAGSI
jgi:uncharacterized membrane protein YebE (DUF533 family)